ncbi:hypothetical protein N7478_000314 [Penicillium angulare]|uniref:uncharacterized protein n=1 Tax=Penicillium angulare TaxID=116970 RepID=UPI00254121C7|nr:uncharacterized protein N7478_000314 [Penicillium angulare]KAJ5291063.1 hypothetical protein N7478_000314 [Penicillium angulare]
MAWKCRAAHPDHPSDWLCATRRLDTNTSPPEKKKRARKVRKPKVVDASSKPKKTLLLDELDDALIDPFYISKLGIPLNSSSPSVVDHLRTTLKTPLISSNASSISGSSRTLTTTESYHYHDYTPATSVDGHNDLDFPRDLHSSKSLSVLNQSDPGTDSHHTKGNHQGEVFSLNDFSTMTAIQRLTAEYGRVAHMGILDHSYRFFVNKARTGALSFKVQNKVAIVGGDPLCEPDPATITALLDEFARYRRRHRWGIAFMGASETFVQDYAQSQPSGWTVIRFGTERVLNPRTNDVLLEKSGKRIAVQSRQLLNPSKGGITLGLYVPAMHGADTALEADLVAIYDAWRAERNNATGPQAFITVYDPFALPALMTFVYSRGPDGQINGFAALRRLGCGGYHIDPCIAAPNSPKGISDLLIVAAMALLNRAEVSYLGFGFEPTHTLLPEDISGMSTPLASLTRDLYSHTFLRLPIHGKKAYYDKFRPDAPQESGLYLVFPSGVPGPRHLMAMMHMANISLRKMLWADLRTCLPSRKSNSNSSPKDAASDPSEQTIPSPVLANG